MLARLARSRQIEVRSARLYGEALGCFEAFRLAEIRRKRQADSPRRLASDPEGRTRLTLYTYCGTDNVAKDPLSASQHTIGKALIEATRRLRALAREILIECARKAVLGRKLPTAYTAPAG